MIISVTSLTSLEKWNNFAIFNMFGNWPPENDLLKMMTNASIISSLANLISNVLKTSIPLFLFFEEDISLEI